MSGLKREAWPELEASVLLTPRGVVLCAWPTRARARLPRPYQGRLVPRRVTRAIAEVLAKQCARAARCAEGAVGAGELRESSLETGDVAGPIRLRLKENALGNLDEAAYSTVFDLFSGHGCRQARRRSEDDAETLRGHSCATLHSTSSISSQTVHACPVVHRHRRCLSVSRPILYAYQVRTPGRRRRVWVPPLTHALMLPLGMRGCSFGRLAPTHGDGLPTQQYRRDSLTQPPSPP